MIAGAPQRLAASAGGGPASRRQKQEDLFVRAPSKCPGDLLRSGAGIPRKASIPGLAAGGSPTMLAVSSTLRCAECPLRSKVRRSPRGQEPTAVSADSHCRRGEEC
jgi:hypothetical protein